MGRANINTLAGETGIEGERGRGGEAVKRVYRNSRRGGGRRDNMMQIKVWRDASCTKSIEVTIETQILQGRRFF